MIIDSFLLAPTCIKQVDGIIQTNSYRICTDSRTYKSGEVFVALKGDSFDGFNFIQSILKNDCPVIIYTYSEQNVQQIRQWATDYYLTCFIGVTDTVLYLQQMSHLHIKNWLEQKPTRKIIGITGSNGKTTHKEMLFHFLQAIAPGKVTATQGNLNNHIGVPLTLSMVDNDHDYAIVEMGSNHPGEIPHLARFSLPNSGLITNVGSAHIEFFQSEENIFKEKGALYRVVTENTEGKGAFVICADDKFLNLLPSSQGLITFGENKGDLKVKCEETSIEIFYPGHSVLLQNNFITGRYNFKNMACAFILANQLIPGHEKELVQAATQFEPRKNRASWIEQKNQVFFLDAYNANPSSMKASLNAFCESLARKQVSLAQCLFVLGDMNELGEQAPQLHKEIGQLLEQLGAQHVTFIGRYNAYYREGFRKECSFFAKREDFNQKWPELRQKYGFFFLKASRSLQLESLLDIR